MLQPKDTRTRERRRLDGLWRFRTDPDGVGRSAGWFGGPLADAIAMPVPASYNDIVPGRTLHDYVGEVFYQTETVLPRTWSGQRIVLRFDAATHRATVWVGDREVVRHEGGYLPFEADITDAVTPGEPVRITVAVDNRLRWDTLPPGFVVDTAHGPRQKQMHDFFNYAGLHRSVWLTATPVTFVDDVTVVTRVDGDPVHGPVTGIVDYEVALAGIDADGAEIETELVDEAGRVVSGGTGGAASLRIDDATLWTPGIGGMYTLVVRVRRGGELVDEYPQRVGIRTVEVRGHEFLINGEPFYFRGFGMHEDHLVQGKGHSDVDMVHDFEILKWIGANSFRTSHYPYAEEFLDYADDHGIVVIDETAAVGMNATVGNVIGANIDRVYGPDYVSDDTRRAHAQHIRELVARDKNHPSVVLWSIANEPESHTPEAVEYFTPLFELTRELDPTRPVGFVNVQFSPAGQCLLGALSDVIMINRYFGWYTQSGDLDAARDALHAELAAWEKTGKPILVTEFGADTIAGLHTLSGAMWSEEFQTELVEMYTEVFDAHDGVQGEHLWNFADFQTSLAIVRADGNRKGAFTRDRRPKAVAHQLRKRWTGSTTRATPQD
jgi:beta-glucuronidase